MVESDHPCPCTSGNTFERCCAPYVRGERPAPTAEALMRSRYTAYTLKNIDYIGSTHDPKSGEDFDPVAAQKWAESARWQGLDVLATEAGLATDDVGQVEFIARFEIEGKAYEHHERARFKKSNERWLYVDGAVVQKPFVRTEPKLGRNDPCHCGSGKKFKKCHGLT